jgi:nitrile hydratase accessory protein
LNPSDAPLHALGSLPLTAAGPVFDEPWQAQAFALVLALHDRGLFAWQAWTEVLAEELQAHAGDDDGTRYYEHWLSALERLLTERGVVAAGSLTARALAWRQAYLRTPHGTPVLPP